MAIPKSPWSVKGIEPETREAAKIAARRAGLTIGQWLNLMIRSAAAEQLSGLQPLPGIPSRDFNAGSRTSPGDHAYAEGAANSNFRPTAPVERAVTRLSERLASLERGLNKSGTSWWRGSRA